MPVSVTNNNLAVIDQPIWEQLVSASANSGTGTVNANDLRGTNRYIYQLLSAANFWRYDTYGGVWQQLPSPPAGTVGAGTCMIFDPGYGSTTNGSLWAVIASAGAPVFYNYDIGTATWSSAKSISGLPGTIGTDADMVKPDPAYNLNGQNNYTGRLTVTTTALANIGATTLSVSALPAAMAANTILNFGTSASPNLVVVTAAAAASATSLTVSALTASVASAASAYWQNTLYLIGNAATSMYQYSISGNVWTTSSGTIPAAVGAGNGLHWLPGYDPDKLLLVRGAASNNIYQYTLSGGTWTTLSFIPSTETFTTGTYSNVRTNPFVTGSGNGTSIANPQTMPNRLMVQSNATLKVYEFDPIGLMMTPLGQNWLVTDGTAIIGNRLNYIVANSIEYVYLQLHTSAIYFRLGLSSQF